MALGFLGSPRQTLRGNPRDVFQQTLKRKVLCKRRGGRHRGSRTEGGSEELLRAGPARRFCALGTQWARADREVGPQGRVGLGRVQGAESNLSGWGHFLLLSGCLETISGLVLGARW